MKNIVFVVFYTTENGTNCVVKFCLEDRQEAVEWDRRNRDKFPRPLIIRKITY